MLADLKGRVALVTGGGSAEGIGFATARLLAAQGAAVGVTSTTERILDRAAELGSRHAGFVCDLRSFENAGKLVDQVIERLGESTSWSTMPAWCRPDRKNCPRISTR